MTDNKLQIWFPTCIFYVENLIDKKENNYLIEEILKIKKTTKKGGKNWISKVYNTFDTLSIHKIAEFKNLCSKIEEQTNLFSKCLGSNENYKINESWLNFYNKNDFQEYHTHPQFVFSAVYFFTNPENSGKLIFENPIEPDMYGLQNKIKTNTLNASTCSFMQKPRTLIIFRSYLRHMVTRCNNIEPRITAAFNLNVLRRVNSLLSADFDLRDWQHCARFNAKESRVEMHLNAKRNLAVNFHGHQRLFKKDESIHTENSYKWSIKNFSEQLLKSGFTSVQHWTDSKSHYALFWAR